MRRLIFALFVLSSFCAWAQLEFPPTLDLTIDEDVYRWADKIRKAVPQANMGSKSINMTYLNERIREEQRLVRRLKDNPEYMRMASQRPPLKTLLIQEGKEVQYVGLGMNSSWNDFISHPDVVNLRATEAAAALTESFQLWEKSSSNRLFSAFARFVPWRSKVLSIKDPQTKWESLRGILEATDLDKLRSGIRANVFNLSDNWELRDLDQVFQRSIDLERKIATLIQNLSSTDLPWIIEDEWPSNSKRLAVEHGVLPLLDGLKARLKAEFEDPKAILKRFTVNREFVLREVPPYLAIYRGCVGEDCSTTHSWAFPYAPYERDWWIEDIKGNILGYVSGAITTYDGDQTLFIRDVRFNGYAKANALVIKALFAARKLYGVKYVTLLNDEDSRNNNNDRSQTGEIAQIRSSYGTQVYQTFLDLDIRLKILPSVAHSELTYDNPKSQARTFLLTGVPVDDVRVSVINSKSNDMETPANNAPRFWTLVGVALETGDVSQLTAEFGSEINWQELLNTLKNTKKLPVAQFEKSISNFCAEWKIPYSNNIKKRYESYFSVGHFAAPDAFSHDNKRQTVRHVIDGIWRGLNEAGAYAALSSNLDLFETNELMIRNVRGLFERRQPADMARIIKIWKAGYRFKHQNLSDDERMWAMTATTEPEIVMHFISSLAKNSIELFPRDWLAEFASRLDNSDPNVDESISRAAAHVLALIDGVASTESAAQPEVVRTLETDENPEVTFPLAVAYLRDISTVTDVSHRAYKIIFSGLLSEKIEARWREAARTVLREMPESRRHALEQHYYEEFFCEHELEIKQAG